MKRDGSTSQAFGMDCGSTRSLRFAYLTVLIVGMCFFFSAPAPAQEPSPSSDSAAKFGSSNTAQETPPITKGEPSPKKSKRKKLKEPRGAFAIAPIPTSNPAIGSGIVPVVGYIFPFSTKDKISPPSVVGTAGLITNNGSRGFVVGGQLFVRENRYQITSAYAHGDLDYNIYGGGIFTNRKIPLEQTGELYLGEILRRVRWKVFVGPRFITGRSTIAIHLNNVTNFPIPPDVGFHTNLTAIGLRATRNTSVNRFYPVNGTFFTFTSDFFSQALDSKYSYQSYKFRFNKYLSLNKNQVLAYDGYICTTGGKPPFYGNCIYGTSSELRGYTAGRYFDRQMLATQLEFRQVLPKRFGAVAFGGVGGVIAGKSQLLQNNHFLPGGGVGLRFEVTKKYHVNLRADFAQGVDGHTFTLGILEAF